MLPPADEGVLQANPAFANVYGRLTGTLLNTDGSSRDPKRDDQRAAVRDELKAHRIEATKHQILRQAIALAIPSSPQKAQQTQQTQQLPASSRLNRRAAKPAIASQPSHQGEKTAHLPPDLLDLLTLLPPFLSSAPSLPATSLALLLSNPPFTALPQHFPQITAMLSTTLSKQASTLAKAVYPTTNPSFIHRHIPSLAITTETLLSTLADGKAQLSRRRTATAHGLVDGYMAQQLAAITLLLALLETKHAGGGSNPQVLRAAHASLSAQTWSLASAALLSHAVDVVYPPAARAALSTYKRHLAGARMRVLDASGVRVAELADYGVSVDELLAGLEDCGGDAFGKGGSRRRSIIGGLASGGGAGGGKGDENKERTMREMARVWREMETRMHEVRRDMKRLGKR